MKLTDFTTDFKASFLSYVVSLIALYLGARYFLSRISISYGSLTVSGAFFLITCARRVLLSGISNEECTGEFICVFKCFCYKTALLFGLLVIRTSLAIFILWALHFPDISMLPSDLRSGEGVLLLLRGET